IMRMRPKSSRVTLPMRWVWAATYRLMKDWSVAIIACGLSANSRRKRIRAQPVCEIGHAIDLEVTPHVNTSFTHKIPNNRGKYKRVAAPSQNLSYLARTCLNYGAKLNGSSYLE